MGSEKGDTKGTGGLLHQNGHVGDVALGLLLVLFFVSSLILTVGVPDMYNSPDERAAATSIEMFVEESRFDIPEPFNSVLGGVLAPRSMVAVGGSLRLITFPGVPLLYGALGKIISFPLTGLLTPLLAVLAVLAWRKILESFLSRRAALIGSILLLTLAGFWFYSARVFMHNVPFLAFLIFGLFFLSRKGFRTHDAALAGATFGIALLMRTSEVVWMLLAGLVFLTVFIRRVRMKPLVVFLGGLMLAFLPFFFWNQTYFENPWQLGYTVSAPVFDPALLPEERMVSDIQMSPAIADKFSEPAVGNFVGDRLSEPLASSSIAADSHVTTSRFLFPFGFHPRLAWQNFVDYQLELTWWMTLLIFLGLPFLWMSRKNNPRQTKILRTILLTTFIAGTYLTFFYGSWNIVDNPDPTAVTLANSYVRYWLPIYLVGTIPAALFIEWLAGRAKTLFSQRLVIGSVLLIVAIFSLRLVFFHPDDGLVRTREVLFESVAIREAVLAETEPESIIVVDRADKILFPARRVVTPLRSERTYEALPELVHVFPTYYYGITLPEEDLAHLRETVLTPRSLKIEPVRSIEIETLYRITAL